MCFDENNEHLSQYDQIDPCLCIYFHAFPKNVQSINIPYLAKYLSKIYVKYLFDNFYIKYLIIIFKIYIIANFHIQF